tara:strand:- start:1627 stop:2208 length:582 start_codon:yes stop_codon:yes gene_type:complete
MFTGIIEEIVEVVDVKKVKGNLHIVLKSQITNELKIDQSISHNGVCLTVVDINDMIYSVVAINETLRITNLAHIAIGDKINIERAMKLGDRLDGHMVQGHVDQVAKCSNIKEENGSFIFTFNYESSNNITVRKGSICVNGVSLTIVDSKKNSFSVAIIPYTYRNTNFHKLKIGSLVNIEFDILGKYISKLIKS